MVFGWFDPKLELGKTGEGADTMGAKVDTGSTADTLGPGGVGNEMGAFFGTLDPVRNINYYESAGKIFNLIKNQ